MHAAGYARAPTDPSTVHDDQGSAIRRHASLTWHPGWLPRRCRVMGAAHFGSGAAAEQCHPPG